MAEDERIAIIRDKVAVHDFEYDSEHVAAHMANEAFDDDDMVTTIINGTVIEASPARQRWLFCGNVPALQPRRGYYGRWLHASVEYIEETGVTIVTAYRPNISEWRTERIRR